MKPITEIKVSGVIYTGKVLEEALGKTADRHMKFAKASIDQYKNTNKERYDQKLNHALNYSNEIRRGYISHNSTLERVEGFLTGNKVSQLEPIRGNLENIESEENRNITKFGNTRVFEKPARSR